MMELMRLDVQKFVDSFEREISALGPKYESGHLESHFGLNPTFLAAGNVFYFVTLAVLYLIMRNRAPLQLTNFMRAYNLSCVILAGAVCYGIIMNCIRYGFISYYGNGERMDARTEGGKHLLCFIWLYYIQKFWEFLDSFIFILRHKWNQLSFLHVYHHSSITIISFAYICLSGSGDVALGAFINSFIHVLMYSHYFLTTFKWSACLVAPVWYEHTGLHSGESLRKAKKKDTLVLVTALADTVVSLSMVEKHLQVKNLRMARPETLTETLGLQGGAVTSLGLINDKEHRVHVYFDRAMIAAGKVNDILVHPTSGNDITLAISAPALLSYVASCGHTAHLMDFDTGDVVDA
ncbi:hypothetical protein PTSG_08543 [Salpingoeca rosetta]|uniref:Elongation of fatty acids protein n=1 Tax=Salpingoeca rosetta (strain ATCC 50818 / BSB-021) TaxID=946362 RepID=F2UJZ8_SALR5|nr:uncharacterized protein PTSG_08543 [Salpingoeca rosetta]EGD77447.1 hypothetical protein PTSG_08543 [Salpingoeca rosetta]|eukprot:XP_004990335.1 hypothetical protein PTSG_08543 [Salpingoeca rosetta]